MRLGHALLLASVMLGGITAPASAEWQIKPFIGGLFGGSTTIVDTDRAVGRRHLMWGANATWLGDWFGIEGDLGRSPGFFSGGSDDALVLQSQLTTFTGNVVVAVPRHLAEYTLRPYFVGGGGLIRATTTNKLGAFELNNTFGAVDVGGGVTGFLSRTFGVNWDVRYFRRVSGELPPGSLLPCCDTRLSFWRANMALAIRF